MSLERLLKLCFKADLFAVDDVILESLLDSVTF